MYSRLNTNSATTAMTGMVARMRLTTYENHVGLPRRHAVFDTPQKKGSGPFTMPETFLRHA